MPERDYSHRAVVDKLGIKPGQAVVIASPSYVDDQLHAQIQDRVGRDLADADEKADVVLVDVDDRTDPVAVLAEWKRRIAPAGGIWLLTRKRGQSGYVDQTKLIAAGGPAGVVDNKICSVSDTLSAMRFVIRRADRVTS
jgi:hypothetical protein